MRAFLDSVDKDPTAAASNEPPELETPEQELAVEKLLTSTVNKIAHPIMDRMRRSHDSGDEGNLQAWREMFNLDGPVSDSDIDRDEFEQ